MNSKVDRNITEFLFRILTSLHILSEFMTQVIGAKDLSRSYQVLKMSYDLIFKVTGSIWPHLYPPLHSNVFYLIDTQSSDTLAHPGLQAWQRFLFSVLHCFSFQRRGSTYLYVPKKSKQTYLFNHHFDWAHLVTIGLIIS